MSGLVRTLEIVAVLDEVRAALGEAWRWGLLGQIPKRTDEQARRAMVAADNLKKRLIGGEG